MSAFGDLKLSDQLLRGVDTLGYASMTEVQQRSLPFMLDGRDVRVQAKTGSGKTAAFGLGLLARLDLDSPSLQALVLCPTRELADQVSSAIRDLARFVPNVRVLALCGGVPVRHQVASLQHEPHVVVGTPGRIQDLINREVLDLDGLSTVVLDEADRMLDMGFMEAVAAILERTPSARTTWMFSATYADEVEKLSRSFQDRPEWLEVDQGQVGAQVRQVFYQVPVDGKPEAVLALLQEQDPESCLVFCHTRLDAETLTRHLREAGASVAVLHGGLDQRVRDQTMIQFANNSLRVLVATDLAARGLDVAELELVISYELPNDAHVHVHRVGRTGRAGLSGLALNLVSSRERPRVDGLASVLNSELQWGTLPKRGLYGKPPSATMRTLVIEAGRKDKLRPGDILGALTGVAGLSGNKVGKIDVQTTRSFVAVARDSAPSAMRKLADAGIKRRKHKVRLL